MKSVIITASNADEAELLVVEQIKKFEAEGYKLGMVSNAGLPKGKIRITFLPQSAFKKETK